MSAYGDDPRYSGLELECPCGRDDCPERAGSAPDALLSALTARELYHLLTENPDQEEFTNDDLLEAVEAVGDRPVSALTDDDVDGEVA